VAEEELPNSAEAEKLARVLGSKVWELDTEIDPNALPPEAGLMEAPPVPPRIYQEPQPVAEVAEVETPPTPSQIVEAMLFVGGSPLSESQARQIVRGLSVAEFTSLIDELSDRYRRQNRPYFVQKVEGGYQLSLRPRYRVVRERLAGGPREAKLTQPALDVLSLVAYQQPITPSEIDSLRGADSKSLLRSLVRLGLVAILQRGEAGQKEVYYGTTPRFLELFGLKHLDDLPTLGEAEPV
jgi:segregation and condensation protein B